MSRQRDREEFIFNVARLGVPPDVARKVLRHAATIQRCAVLACSSEAADRDRVPCPGATTGGKCICDFGYTVPGEHGDVPRIARTSQRCEARVVALLAPFGLGVRFQGDPRGYCARIMRPGDRREERYSDGLGVPA